MMRNGTADAPMAIKSAEFVKSTVQAEQYPSAALPEVAFAGRSNVGKSSLINCLVQRKKLVRTSRTPGQTQTINFFLVNDEFYFVDLPGYGFARVPERIRQEWGPMVETYLSRRVSLRGIVQIMDVRHPPTPTDLDLWQWLNSREIPVIPVLTKADKIARSQWESQLRQASLSLGVPREKIFLVSAVSRQGRDELLRELSILLKPPTAPE
jgi:GTP-binding protein